MWCAIPIEFAKNGLLFGYTFLMNGPISIILGMQMGIDSQHFWHVEGIDNKNKRWFYSLQSALDGR